MTHRARHIFGFNIYTCMVCVYLADYILNTCILIFYFLKFTLPWEA